MSADGPAGAGGSAQTMAGLLARQRAACDEAGWADLARRRAHLRALGRALLAHRAALTDAIGADFGHRAAREIALVEIMPVLQTLRYLDRRLPGLMRPSRRRVAAHFLPARAMVLRQPLGVVGIVAPWNYPVVLSLAPLATALAAGNRAMLKPSEHAPRTAAVLADLLGATFAEDHVAVVQGDAATAAAFVALPFDHLVFTGATGIGREVARIAGGNLVPTTLELGGKSPVILGHGIRGAGLARAARRIAYGKLLNAGQTCMAPDYVLAPADRVAAFADAFAEAVAHMYPGLPGNADYGSIVSDRHFQRLQALVRQAGDRGAQVRVLGSGSAPLHPRQMAPVLLTDIPPDAEAMREEIFGPVLPVIACDTLDAAIAFVNARPRPLALYLFETDRDERAAVLARTVSGTVACDETILQFAQDDLPFGGVGPSGMGTYRAAEGFAAMSHDKAVLIQRRVNLASIVHPPFGRRLDRMLSLFLR